MIARYRLLPLLAAAVLGFAAADARAGPATLQIGGGTNPTFPGTDPNLIGSSGILDIQQVSGGVGNLTQPFLLILGIPEKGGATNSNFFGGTNPVTSVTTTGSPSSGTSVLGGTNIDGGHWNTTTGYAGTFTSGEAYSKVGLEPPDVTTTNQSNNFGNWAGAEYANNNKFSATGFDLYVFQISATLGAKDIVSVTFPTSGAGSLPMGTMVIAYGQITTTNGHHTSTKSYATPFTQAGFTQGSSGPNVATPAPPSIVLMGVGAVCALAFAVRSSRKRIALSV